MVIHFQVLYQTMVLVVHFRMLYQAVVVSIVPQDQMVSRD
jgi:hypothetical protein